MQCSQWIGTKLLLWIVQWMHWTGFLPLKFFRSSALLVAGNKKEEFDRIQGALDMVYSDIIIKYSANNLWEKCPNLNFKKIHIFNIDWMVMGMNRGPEVSTWGQDKPSNPVGALFHQCLLNSLDHYAQLARWSLSLQIFSRISMDFLQHGIKTFKPGIFH